MRVRCVVGTKHSEVRDDFLPRGRVAECATLVPGPAACNWKDQERMREAYGWIGEGCVG